MQPLINQLSCLAFTAAVACGNIKVKDADRLELGGTLKNVTATASPQGDGIVGDWTLAFETYDENENKKLDPEERKKAFSNHFFFRFNADGSALVNFKNTAQGAFKAHYKISERKNSQFLSVFLEGDTNENPDGLNSGYYIMGMDKNELVLLSGITEKAFWVFKRS